MINTRTLFNSFKYRGIVRYSYVRYRDLANIKKNYGETKWEKVKMYGVMFAQIAKQGISGAKADFFLYQNLKSKK